MRNFRFYCATLLPLLLGVSSCAQAQFLYRGPIVGAVSDTSARVTVETSAPASLILDYSTTSDFSSNVERTPVADPIPGNQNFTTFQLTNLLATTRYYLRVDVNGKVASNGEQRSFKTFPRSHHDTSFVFTFGSCQKQNGSTHRSNVFSLMQKDNPLLFLQIGDWAYPDENIGANFAANDSTLAKSYERKYDPSEGMDSLVAGRAIDYIYDDHDYGANNADGTFPYKQNSISAYKRFFPHYDLQNDSSGLWHTFIIGEVQFFVLDLRSERSPNLDAIQYDGKSYSFNPPAGHSILRGTPSSGIDQKTWLLDALVSSQARWKIIISSVNWSPAAKAELPLLTLYADVKKDPSKLNEAVDKWVGFPEDQDSIIAVVKRLQLKNVIVCSGDLHTAMMDNGANSVFPEIVSGNLEVPNSRVYKDLDSIGLGGLWNRGGQLDDTLDTYGRITVQTSPRHALICEIVNERDSVVSSMTLADSNIEGTRYATDPFPKFGTHIVQSGAGKLFAIASVNEETPGRVYISDMLGHQVRLLADGTLHGGDMRFRLLTNSLPSGTYLFVLEAKGMKWSSKFEVSR